MEHHLSFSSLNQFQSCPRSWFLQRVLGKKQPQGDSASFGKAFESEVCKRMGLIAETRSDGRPNEDTILDPEPQKDVNRAVDLYFATPGNWMMSPGDIVAQHEIKITEDQWGTLGDEYGVSGQIHLPFIGYIDLLKTEPNGVVRHVADLKTTSGNDLQISWVLQVTLYCLLTRARKAEIHAIVKYKSRAKEPKPDTYTAFFYQWFPNEEAFKWGMTWVNSVAKRIYEAQNSSLNKMEALPGYHCSWCPDSSSCAAFMLSELIPFSTSKVVKE